MIENDKTTPTAKKINKRFWFILGLISVFALGLVISYNQVENTEKTDKNFKQVWQSAYFIGKLTDIRKLVLTVAIQ